MIATKAVDVAALQVQAAALGGTHVGHGITGLGVNPTYDLRCADANGTVLSDLCSAGVTAYNAYTAPTTTAVAAGAGAGTGATVALHQPDPNLSTDVRGIVDVTIGTAPTADANGHYPLAALTFGNNSPWVQANQAPLGAMIDRVNTNAISLGLVCSNALTVTGFQIVSQNAPTAGQTYRLSYALG